MIVVSRSYYQHGTGHIFCLEFEGAFPNAREDIPSGSTFICFSSLILLNACIHAEQR